MSINVVSTTPMSERLGAIAVEYIKLTKPRVISPAPKCSLKRLNACMDE